MKFAVALFALTLAAQTFVPAYSQSTDEILTPDSASVASVPLVEGTSVNVLGGEGAASANKFALSDDQKEKFYEMKNKLLNETGPKKVALAEQKRLLKDLLTKDSLDRKAVQTAQDKINALRTDLANVHLAYRMDMQAELTPDQRKAIRFRGLKSGKGKSHHGKMRGRHRATGESGATIGSDTTTIENFAPANI